MGFHQRSTVIYRILFDIIVQNTHFPEVVKITHLLILMEVFSSFKG